MSEAIENRVVVELTEEVALSLARDAYRYRWLRNQLAVEDIEEMRRNYLGAHDEAESVKCDVAVDAARGATP